MGEGYGPKLVGRSPMTREELSGKRVAVPGLRTSAYLALKLFAPDIQIVVVPFDQIVETLRREEAEAGVIIHEGQLTYRSYDLHKIADLGEWWKSDTGLPLPLGGNAAERRRLTRRERRSGNSAATAVTASINETSSKPSERKTLPF